MNYLQTLDYLYSTLPMFQRVGAVAYKNDLNNTIALCEALDNPQHRFKSVHVAGTNGKGSSSHMLTAILQCAGYKTGLYTSPHLKEFTERIRINGKEITQDFVVGFVARTTPILEKIHPSFFETTVAMAFDYFASEKVDIAVIEVGLGGRLDSTNVISPIVSLITNIGYDHKDLLGDTLPKIAAEKAGIIKRATPVVISERQPEVDNVFLEKATTEQAPILFASDHYRLEDHSTAGMYDVYSQENENPMRLICELKGAYQKKNIPGVLLTIENLRKLGLKLTDAAVQQGIAHVSTLTGLKGRWQKLREHPLTICDVGHNEDGIREVVRQIKSVAYETLYIIFGVVREKDITAVLSLLPPDAFYFFCEAHIPRALPAAELAARAHEHGLKGKIMEDVNEALQEAYTLAGRNDLIFIGGSTFVVGEINGL